MMTAVPECLTCLKAFLLNSDLAVKLWEHIFFGDIWTWLIEDCLMWLDSMVRGLLYCMVYHRIVLENV